MLPLHYFLSAISGARDNLSLRPSPSSLKSASKFQKKKKPDSVEAEIFQLERKWPAAPTAR